MMHWDYGWGMGWMMGLWWLFWILAIGAVVWALARSTGSRSTGREESPEVILKRRYARGEMSREEYDQRLTDQRPSDAPVARQGVTRWKDYCRSCCSRGCST
jgi:putative membrane protein